MIDILLSTYNGAKFLKDFLKSLETQTFKNWRLIVRDDGSVDNTIFILEDFKKIYPEKIQFVKDNKENLGACKSFLNLLKTSQSDYIMFADQDDIWLPKKIETSFFYLRELEKKYGKDTPILVHTDLKVVDKNLNIISPSLWKYQGLKPFYKDLNYILVQNNVTGCTVIINKALKNCVQTLPENAIMHDWWLALIASSFGIIEYIPEATILYRQHESQDTSAKKYSFFNFYNRFKDKKNLISVVIRTIKQAEEFYSIYKNRLSNIQEEIILDYINLINMNKINRIKKIFERKFFKQGFLRNLGFLYTLWIIKNDKT